MAHNNTGFGAKQALVQSLESSLYTGNQSSAQKSSNPRDVSPNRARIQDISEKMHTMTAVQGEEKMTKKEAIDNKLKNIEEQISRVQVSEESKFKLMKDQIDKLQQNI
jgi:hypothetical protein